MATTKVRQHQWVKHMIIPVDVISNPENGKPMALVRLDSLDAAEASGVLGCAACSAPLDTQSASTECPGFDDGLDS